MQAITPATIDLTSIAIMEHECLDDLPAWIEATPESVRVWAEGYIDLARDTWECQTDSVCSVTSIMTSITRLTARGWQTIETRQREKELAEIADEWRYDRRGNLLSSEQHTYYNAN